MTELGRHPGFYEEGLLAGDWVVVTGTVPLGENRVIATSVKRLES